MKRVVALLGLTVSTGIFDAVSFLALGNVFTALMTGNVAFLGFAVAGIERFSAVRSGIALFAFFTGAACAGLLDRRTESSMRRFVFGAGVLESCGVAVSIAVSVGGTPGVSEANAIIASLAFAMGVQTAVMLRLKDPDLKTTVLTLTVASLGAHALWRAEASARRWRQAASIASLLVGSGVGASIVTAYGMTPALGTAAVTLLSSFLVLTFAVDDESQGGGPGHAHRLTSCATTRPEKPSVATTH